MQIFTVSEREKLLKDELRRIVEIMKNEGDIEKIILFGSLAAGKVHEWSDIDMLVIKETEKRHIERILELNDLIHPKVGIDLFVYTPEEYEFLLQERFSFLMNILKTGKVMYEKGN